MSDSIDRKKTKLAVARAIKYANDNGLDVGCCIYNAIDDVPEEKRNLPSDWLIAAAWNDGCDKATRKAMGIVDCELVCSESKAEQECLKRIINRISRLLQYNYKEANDHE